MTGFVYFMQAGEGGAVKIGFSATSVERRIKGNQVGCPQTITLLGVIEGNTALEKRFHKAFRRFAIRGEWFEPHPRLLALIAKISWSPLQPNYDDEPNPLRRARLRLGLTQREIAKRVGTNAPMVCSIENGRKTPSLRVASRLAKELGLVLDRDLVRHMIARSAA